MLSAVHISHQFEPARDGESGPRNAGQTKWPTRKQDIPTTQFEHGAVSSSVLNAYSQASSHRMLRAVRSHHEWPQSQEPFGAGASVFVRHVGRGALSPAAFCMLCVWLAEAS